MKSAKKYLFMVIFALMLFSPVAQHIGTAQTAQAMSASTLKKRAKKAKKNLPKKVKKLLAKKYYRPGCQIMSSKRKGKYLYCELQGPIGDGAYMISAKVNLSTGKVKITSNMVSIPNTFKISVK